MWKWHKIVKWQVCERKIALKQYTWMHISFSLEKALSRWSLVTSASLPPGFLICWWCTSKRPTLDRNKYNVKIRKEAMMVKFLPLPPLWSPFLGLNSDRQRKATFKILHWQYLNLVVNLCCRILKGFSAISLISMSSLWHFWVCWRQPLK